MNIHVKYIPLFFFLIALSLPLYAQDADLDDARKRAEAAEKELNQTKETPQTAKKTAAPKKAKSPVRARRLVEFGVDAGVGVANNLIGAKDLKTNMVINLDDFSKKISKDGVAINAEPSASVFFNINLVEAWGFKVSADVEGGIYANLPKSLFDLLMKGNRASHNASGEFSVSGRIFADTALNFHAKFGKLEVGLTPAMYIPLIYIPKSTVSYTMIVNEKTGGLTLETTGSVNVYSPFSLKEMNVGEAFGGSGFDLSLEGKYALLPILDLGLEVSHIPVVASTLKYQMETMPSFSIETDKEGKGLLTGNPDITFTTDTSTTYQGNASFKVYRPLGFNLYGLVRPFKINFIVLKPNVGFNVSLVDEDPFFYFNWGVEGQVNIFRLLFLHIGTGYEDTLWRHRLGFELNLRIFELDLEAGLRSQDFANSFQVQGLSVKLGLRFGF